MKQSYSKLFFIFFIVFSFLKPNEIKAQCVTGAEFNIAYPKKDMRGVFLPSVASITWPSNRNATPAVQQAELLTMLDNIEANGYNSVFLQVRPECDALYPSAIEPWSYWLTGAQGTPPSPLWDPLEFAINESHLRGLDLHAWLNPYRAKRGSDPAAPTHVTVEHPEWIFTASNNPLLKIVNPGIPAVTDYIVSVVEDLATRYDLDGIHFDDYFYPSGGMTNQDSDAYANYNPGGLSLADWRRNNVNQMISEVYDAIQTINTSNNKNIVFGVSPAGIWKSGTPPGTSGSSSYSALYCDPIAWMQADKVDYIAPQLYWKITGPQDYHALSQWWNDQAVNGTQIYISQAYYKMIDGNNWPSSELQNQINKNRTGAMNSTFGQIAYRYNEIGNNDKGINTALNAAQFKYKSFAPPILGAGKDAICAKKPENIRFESLKLKWDTPAPASDGDLPKKYVVYAFDNAAQATTNKNDGSKILDIVAGNELTLTQVQINTKFFVVTSLDKNNNESGDFCNFPLPEINAPCSVTSITAPTAKYNCAGSFTATTTTVFPIKSSTVVTWNYNFGGGNTFTQTQKVNILDNVAPNVITKNITITLTGAVTTITASDINNGSSDNCAIKTMSIDKDSFTCADIGVHPVTLTVEDNNGNSASAIAMVTVESSLTEYTISGWSNGVPHMGSLAKFSSNYSTSVADIEACSCEVDNNATVTVEAGDYMKVEGNITVNSGSSLFVDHEGSLVQVDDAATVTNNGSITVRKITPFLAPRYFMVLGSPMTAETRSGVYGSSVLVRNHTTSNFIPHPGVTSGDPGAENFADDNGNDWQNYTGTINAGEGYLVLPQPDLASSGSYTLDYTLGTLNNGQVNYNVTYNGSQNASPNIVGNPYASAIDANLFLDDIDNTMIDAVYFWEHLTSANPSYPGYKVNNYDMGDISMYNSSGGVPAANDPGNSTQPNGYISSGQGFGFKATAAGTATFKNYMRVTDNNNTYRRPIAAKDRLWLQVSNETYGLNSTVLISFSEESIDGYDARFDAKRLATPVSIYSILDTGEELAIQGRSAFNENQEIPLGFASQVEENQEFTIAISNQDGTVWPDVQVYLVDRAKNVVHNLSNSHYIFKSKEGAHNSRFLILFKSTVLDTPTNQLQNISIVPNPTTGYITIISPQTAVSSVEVFDIRGRKLMNVDYNKTQYSLDLSSLQSATYFVKINTEEGSLIKRVVKN